MIQTATHNTRLRLVAAFLLVGLAALLPRLLDLGGFVIEDEARYWIDRSHLFLEALEGRDFAATAISTHPGVTTMWSGSTGIFLKRKLLEWGLLQAAPFPVALALMRLPAVLAHVGGVLLGYALLRRMLPVGIATLAALLWATDPFVIGLQRMLHVDGLMATFTMLSVLAACVYWHHRGSLGFLLLSAACGALAVLSKSPGLVVLPVIALIGLWGMGGRGWGRVWPFALWGAVFVLTIALAWPAVWADPLRVYELLRVGVEVEGANPHVQGNFFLGQRNDEPGLLFYPAAVALRLTPWTLAGLLLLPLAWRRADLSPTQRRDLLLLLGYALLFTLALSLFSKKLNRYSMPIFPALDILAAVGLVWGTGWLAQQVGRLGAGAQRWLPRVLAGLLVAAALLNAAWWHPYSIAYFNPLLGGAQTGADTFLIGSGEGMEQAAAWLNQQPDITGVIVATTMKPVLQPYLREGAQSSTRSGDRLPDKAAYAVLYVRNTWDGAAPPFDRFYRREPPLHTVTIHGVQYAWIYQVPPPAARFGSSIHLGAYDVDSVPLRASGALTVTVRWWTEQRLSQDYLLFAHLLDASGQRVAQIDAPPAGPHAPSTTWQPGRYQHWAHPLPLPPDLPPGAYWLALGLYDPDDFARLPVTPEPPPAAPDAGGNALLLPVTIEAGAIR